jgi:type II secretory ATPase GspE/PulE/Tfp pilus assembly ATPase PilB-like protein
MYGQTGSGKTFTMLGSLADTNTNPKTPISNNYEYNKKLS